MPRRVLVIVPAWNEQATVGDTVREIRAATPDLPVLVVSDGSTDRTPDVARAAGALVLELPYNLGVGGAMRAGFRYAVRHGHPAAVQVDADGQHDPGQVQHLLEALDGGADLVIGTRFASAEGGYRVGRTRGRAMGAMRVAVRLLSGRRFSDTSSGFRAFSGPMIDFFSETYPSEYMDSVEALLLALREGFAVVEVPVTMRERQAGQASNRNLRLVYHFVRLSIVMVSGASRRRVPVREAVP